MNKRHKHADVIIAWAEGAEIECRTSPDRPWTPMTNTSSWYGFDDVEYRVKPSPVIRKFRVALINGVSRVYPSVVENKQQEIIYEKDAFFVRWLTDWIEYEVEE